MITREFVTAGDAIFTVEPRETWVASMIQLGHDVHPHYTYKVERVEFDGNDNPPKVCYFVKSLTGPDNTSDYTYLGMLDVQTGEVRLTKKSAFPADSFRVRIVQRVLSRIWANDVAAIDAAGSKVHHIGKCGRCSRPLTTPESCETGIGPECRRKLAGVA